MAWPTTIWGGAPCMPQTLKPATGSSPIEDALSQLESTLEQEGVVLETIQEQDLSSRINNALLTYLNNFPRSHSCNNLFFKLLSCIKSTDLHETLPDVIKFFCEFNIKPLSYGDHNPFIVNGRTYHAYGPAGPIDRAINKSIAAKEYVTKIHEHGVVINLIEKSNEPDHCYYMKYDFFKDFYEENPSKVLIWYNIHHSSQDPSKQLVHFHSWSDGGIPPNVFACFEVAAIAVKAQNEGKTVFAHCMAGLQRTSIIIVMCELLHNSDQVSKMNNDEVREFIKGAIRQMNAHLHSRFPSIAQINFILGDKFIDAAKKKCEEYRLSLLS